jgi:hypothetical protein
MCMYVVILIDQTERKVEIVVMMLTYYFKILQPRMGYEYIYIYIWGVLLPFKTVKLLFILIKDPQSIGGQPALHQNG